MTAHAWQAKFGLPPKHTLSQRDVPGMTRSVIPILKEVGVGMHHARGCQEDHTLSERVES